MRPRRAPRPLSRALACILLAACATHPEPVPQPSALRWELQSGRSIALAADGHTLWRFNHSPVHPHCYFHPLALPGTPALTLDAPADHVWHHGLWFSWKFIDGVNYWEHAPGADRPPRRTRWGKPTIELRPDGSTRIRMDLEYAPGEDTPVLGEQRSIEISAPAADGSYAIDWQGTFTALAETVVLDRTPLPGEPGGKVYGGYAGLSLRLVNLEERAAATPEGPVEFNTEERYRGRHLAFEYGGSLDGQPVGLTVLDRTAGRYIPSPWYAIRSGAMSFFTPAVICYAPLQLRRGESFTLRYRIHVHPGRWDAERLADLVRSP